jgi:predicted aconitase
MDGEEGYIAQKCMKFLVDYGEAAGAERLVDIDGTADIHPGDNPCWIAEYAITQAEIEDCARRGEQFKVPTFANKPVPGFLVEGWQGCGTWPNCDPDYHKEKLAKIKPLVQMGMVPSLSCDYYLGTSYYPTVGQHCSWGESSAIPWANAVLGARTNFDGCFQTAYLGKVPYYDLHVTENRAATVLVEFKGDLLCDMDWELFGWAAGEYLGNKVPAFTGLGRPTVTQLVKLNGALNTGGQVRMYHIPGVTPEASCLESAFQGKEPKETVTLTREDLRRVYDLVNWGKNRQVDFVYLGCPFYNIIELQKAAQLLYGRRVRCNTWIVTSPGVYALADQMGLRAKIERSGAQLLAGACACEMRGELLPFQTMATDSTKQNYYMTGFRDPKPITCWYGTTEDCIDAAVTGTWKGGWR